MINALKTVSEVDDGDDGGDDGDDDDGGDDDDDDDDDGEITLLEHCATDKDQLQHKVENERTGKQWKSASCPQS